MPTLVSTGQLTIVDANDGFSASLTAQSAVLPADAAGTVLSYAGANTTFKIIEGGADTSASWSYFVSATGGGIAYRDSDDGADRTLTGAVNGLITGTVGYVAITSLTQNLSYLDITARKAGQQDIVRRFSVANAKAGSPGSAGSAGTRGTVQAAYAIAGALWVDASAAAALAGIGAGAAISGDVVTLYNSGAGYAETRAFNGSSWVSIGAFIGGNALVDNTVVSSKIAADAITASKIAAGAITAAKIQAGAIDTSKLLVLPSAMTLNPDPYCKDASAWALWTGTQPTFTTVADGYAGPSVMRGVTGSSSWVNGANRIPVDPAKTYRIRGVARKSATANGLLYIGVALFDSAGTNISGDGAQWSYGAASANPGSTAWTVYKGFVGGTIRGFPGNAVWMVPLVILNHGGTVGYFEVQDIRLEEVVPGELIVDGAISAQKIAAGAIAVGSAAIANGAIRNALIENAAVDSAKIADAAIISAKINDAAVNTAKIADAAITSAKIVDAAITNAKIADLDAGKINAGTIATARLAVGSISPDKFSPTGNNNLLDPSEWTLGNTGSQTRFGENGCSATGYNTIVVSTGPDGQPRTMWRAVSGTAVSNNPEGGWNTSILPIDHLKAYRFSVWVRCSGGTTGSFYLGVGAYTVNYMAGGIHDNPYFLSNQRSTLTQGRWYLIVGYVFPSTWATGQQNYSGVYDGVTGQRVQTGNDFRWVSGQTSTYHRSYQYYTTAAGTTQDFFAPRIDLCDGSEPQLQELLAMGAVSGINPVTAANVDALIGSAAIKLAQINTATIGNLSALTANVGLLRTAASGGRVEIQDNIIRVYDASNVLRVKIGNLAL